MKTISPIIRSITTEKSSLAQSKGQYAFVVDMKATKIDIKRAIKEIYGADVASVKTNILQAKTRMIKGKYEFAKRPRMKKAIVTLKGKKATLDPNKIKDSKK